MPDRVDRPGPELLSPAGSPDALRAAVANGADAVYLGVDRFNARRGAANFTLDELPEAIAYAHLRGVRAYLTANVVILPEEITDALDLIDAAWGAGVDAVIVQDLGLLTVVARTLPDVRLHASTQLNAHNTPTARLLCDLGVSRITLARETSVAEVERIARSVAPCEIESFVHGALCMCYSGQCLMSSMIGGRSANRGMCAQPCRLGYELIDSRGKPRNTPGPYLLSPKDLCGLDVLPRIIQAGVAALKIEGRAKEPEYVALVTGVYRKALDRAISDPDGFLSTEAERAILDEAFSRGFSSAYLGGIRGNEMMSYQRPNNRGVLVGRIAGVDGKDARVALESELDAEDTIEVWTSRGRFAQRVGPMHLGDAEVRVVPPGETPVLRVERGVSRGDRVFRVLNARLRQAAQRTYANEQSPQVPVHVSVRVVVGRPVRIELRYEQASACAEGPVVEVARTKPLTAEEIAEHVGRFGGTAFRPSGWEIELQPDAGLGYSVLHQVRRDAVDALTRVLLGAWDGRRCRHPEAHAFTGKRRSPRADVVPEIVALVPDAAAARSCLEAGAQWAMIPWSAVADNETSLPERVGVEIPRIAHDAEVEQLLRTARLADRVVVGNLGLLAAVSEASDAADAHWSMNASNEWSVSALSDLGADTVWLSAELTLAQIRAITSRVEIRVGVAAYGRQELMVTEHCILASVGECRQACETCRRRESPFALRDAKGYSFPVVTDTTGRSHIYNSIPLDMTRSLAEIAEAGVAAIRLDFTIEDRQTMQRLTSLARQRLIAATSGRESAQDSLVTSATTTGHFFRGVR